MDGRRNFAKAFTRELCHSVITIFSRIYKEALKAQWRRPLIITFFPMKRVPCRREMKNKVDPDLNEVTSRLASTEALLKMKNLFLPLKTAIAATSLLSRHVLGVGR